MIEKPISTEYSNNSLVLQNVQNKDEGQYVCISESPGLKVDVTASLLVHSKSGFSMYTKQLFHNQIKISVLIMAAAFQLVNTLY